MWLYLTSATGSNTFIWNIPLLHLLTCQYWLCAAIGPLAQNHVTYRHHAIGSTELSLKSSPPTPPQGTVGRRWGPIWGHPGSPWSQWQPLSSASPTDQMLLLTRAAWSSLCLGDSFPPITTHHTSGFVHPRTRMLIHVLLSLQRWLPWQQSWLRTRCRGPGEKGKMSPSDVQTLTSVLTISSGTRRKKGKHSPWFFEFKRVMVTFTKDTTILRRMISHQSSKRTAVSCRFRRWKRPILPPTTVPVGLVVSHSETFSFLPVQKLWWSQDPAGHVSLAVQSTLRR